MTHELCDIKFDILSEISGIVGKAYDLEIAVQHILSILFNKMNMTRAVVTVISRDTGKLGVLTSHGLTPEEQNSIFSLAQALMDKLFKKPMAFGLRAHDMDPFFMDKINPRLAVDQNVVFLGAPVIHNNSLQGLMMVDNLMDATTPLEERLKFLAVVSGVVSQLIDLNYHIQDLHKENVSLRNRASRFSTGLCLVGKSPYIVEARKKVESVAPTKAPVLLSGDPGTGKAYIAQAIHDLSQRRLRSFVCFSCVGEGKDELERKLFGVENHAAGSEPGKLEQADLGTIFFNNVDKLPLEVQASLVQVLQEKQVVRQGGDQAREFNVRLLSSCSCDIAQMAKKGVFRDDLLALLNVYSIEIPSLCQRKDDLESLIGHLLVRVSKEYGRDLTFTSKALEILVDYDWPGNLKEMENMVERLVILAKGDEIDSGLVGNFIKTDRVKPKPVVYDEVKNGRQSLEDLERAEVIAALRRNSWVQSRAADELGLTTRQIGYRIKRYGLGAYVATQKAKASGGL